MGRESEVKEAVDINRFFADRKASKEISIDDVMAAVDASVGKNENGVRVLKNTVTGETATLSNSAISKMFSSTSNRLDSQNIGGILGKEAIANIGSIFDTAILVKTTPDAKHGTKNRILRYANVIRSDGENFIVKMTVKEIANKRLELTDIEIEDNGGKDLSAYDMKVGRKNTAEGNISGDKSPTIPNGTDITINDLIDFVNAYSEDSIQIDGKSRAARNSLGRRIARTEEGLRAFYKWFGDSKVVDKQGRPLVVYHGGGRFNTFKYSYDGTYYFTTNKEYAEKYAKDYIDEKGRKGLGELKSVYLSIKNPAPQEVIDRNTLDQVIAQGYDGHIFEDVLSEKDDKIIRVFDPNQIKSVENRGSFSPESDNIYYQGKIADNGRNVDKRYIKVEEPVDLHPYETFKNEAIKNLQEEYDNIIVWNEEHKAEIEQARKDYWQQMEDWRQRKIDKVANLQKLADNNPDSVYLKYADLSNVTVEDLKQGKIKGTINASKKKWSLQELWGNRAFSEEVREFMKHEPEPEINSELQKRDEFYIKGLGKHIFDNTYLGKKGEAPFSYAEVKNDKVSISSEFIESEPILKEIRAILKKDGWKPYHTSGKRVGLSSSYYEKEGYTLRLSNHELPMTAERQYNTNMGFRHGWNFEYILDSTRDMLDYYAVPTKEDFRKLFYKKSGIAEEYNEKIDDEQGEVYYQGQIADNAGAVELTINTAEETAGVSEDEFKQKMLDTLKSFKGNKIFNQSLGGEIEIRTSSIKKYKSFFADKNKRLIVPYIPELLAKARFTKEASYTKATEPNIKAYYKSDLPINIDNDLYNVHLTVREDQNGNFFWDAQIKESPQHAAPATNPGDTGAKAEQSAFEDSISLEKKEVNKSYYQRAFAGSRVDYDEPSLEAIGSGEGAQAHGWGLYYALDKDVAEDYRTNFTLDTGSVEYDGKIVRNYLSRSEKENASPQERVLYELLLKGNYVTKEKIDEAKQSKLFLFNSMAKKSSLDRIIYGDEKTKEAERRKLYEEIEALNSLDISKFKYKKKGQVHEVDLPENPYLLDEQKPFSEQSDIVKKGIIDTLNSMNLSDKQKAMFKDNIENRRDTGKEIYEELTIAMAKSRGAGLQYSSKENMPFVSKALSENGVKGITYYGREDGRCFVIFNPKDVKVIQKFYQTGELGLEGGMGKAPFGAQAQSQKEKVIYQVFGQYEPAKKLITLFQGKNSTTLVHELLHHYLPIYLTELEKAGKFEQLKGLYEALGVQSYSDIARQRAKMEQLIDLGTSYIYYNESPNEASRSLFERAKQWMLDAYDIVKKFVKPSKEVDAFFNELFAREEENLPDIRDLKGKSAELAKILKGAASGQELTVNGLSLRDIANLRKTLYARIPRAGESLADAIRQAGGIDTESALAKALGYDSRKGSDMGFWNYKGAINDESSLIDFLTANGYLNQTESQSYDDTSAIWDKVEKLINDRNSVYNEKNQRQQEYRENALSAQKLNNQLVKVEMLYFYFGMTK